MGFEDWCIASAKWCSWAAALIAGGIDGMCNADRVRVFREFDHAAGGVMEQLLAARYLRDICAVCREKVGACKCTSSAQCV